MLAVFKFQSYLVGNLRFIRLLPWLLNGEIVGATPYIFIMFLIGLYMWLYYIRQYMSISDLGNTCVFFLIWAIHVFISDLDNTCVYFWFGQHMCLFLIWAIHVFISDLGNTCVYFWFGQYMCLFLIWAIHVFISDLDNLYDSFWFGQVPIFPPSEVGHFQRTVALPPRHPGRPGCWGLAV